MSRAAPWADLHLHTSHSDGRLAPAAVVATAAARGLRALAIVDHDGVSGLAEALAAGRRLGVEVVPGIELTAHWGGRTCHVLGYYLDPAATGLTEALAATRQAAAATVTAALEALRARGIALAPEELQAFRGRYPTPTTLLLALIRHRRLRSRADLRAVLAVLRAGGPRLAAAQAIALVQAAGGAAVLAHPGRHGGLDSEMLAALAAAGLDGLEVAHPAHSLAQRTVLTAAAERHGLVPTGGSDWHGRPRDLPPGTLGTDAAALAALRRRAATRLSAPGLSGGYLAATGASGLAPPCP
jgi:predicted metal-dependent phosphoesterase TrpH